MIRQRLENWHASDTSNGFKPIRSSIDANNFDKFKSKTWFQWFYHWFSIALEFESSGIRISQSLDSKLPWFLWITTVIVTVKLISYNSYLTELHDIGLRIGVGSFKWKWKISFLIQKWQRSPRTHIWNLFCKKVLSTLLYTCTNFVLVYKILYSEPNIFLHPEPSKYWVQKCTNWVQNFVHDYKSALRTFIIWVLKYFSLFIFKMSHSEKNSAKSSNCTIWKRNRENVKKTQINEKSEGLKDNLTDNLMDCALINSFFIPKLRNSRRSMGFGKWKWRIRWQHNFFKQIFWHRAW